MDRKKKKEKKKLVWNLALIRESIISQIPKTIHLKYKATYMYASGNVINDIYTIPKYPIRNFLQIS